MHFLNVTLQNTVQALYHYEVAGIVVISCSHVHVPKTDKEYVFLFQFYTDNFSLF